MSEVMELLRKLETEDTWPKGINTNSGNNEVLAPLSLLWNIQFEKITSPPVIINNRIIVTWKTGFFSKKHYIAALKSESGKTIWSRTLKEGLSSKLLTVGDLIYGLTKSGDIVIIDPESGESFDPHSRKDIVIPKYIKQQLSFTTRGIHTDLKSMMDRNLVMDVGGWPKLLVSVGNGIILNSDNEPFELYARRIDEYSNIWFLDALCSVYAKMSAICLTKRFLFLGFNNGDLLGIDIQPNEFKPRWHKKLNGKVSFISSRDNLVAISTNSRELSVFKGAGSKEEWIQWCDNIIENTPGNKPSIENGRLTAPMLGEFIWPKGCPACFAETTTSVNLQDKSSSAGSVTEYSLDIPSCIHHKDSMEREGVRMDGGRLYFKNTKYFIEFASLNGLK
jgi:hypothetical protein